MTCSFRLRELGCRTRRCWQSLKAAISEYFVKKAGDAGLIVYITFDIDLGLGLGIGIAHI